MQAHYPKGITRSKTTSYTIASISEVPVSKPEDTCPGDTPSRKNVGGGCDGYSGRKFSHFSAF